LILAGIVSANSVQAAPATLASSISGVAVSQGATATGSTLPLIKGALKIMAWTKAKAAVVIGLGLLFAAGTATVAVKKIHDHGAYLWQVDSKEKWLAISNRVPPQVEIVPTRFPRRGWASWDGAVLVGINESLEMLLLVAYDHGLYRTVIQSNLTDKRYDYIANLPAGAREALQRSLESKLQLKVSRETRNTGFLS